MWLAYVKMIAMELNKSKNSGTSNTSTSDRHLEGNALSYFAHPAPYENAPSPHFVNHSPIGKNGRIKINFLLINLLLKKIKVKTIRMKVEFY